ncbi:hypothetical protein [Oceanicoccus sagamiensis]|uniref:Uncharacterized protein n=1 Tax=Oceanicoccus sagamiensis TaxID=716816 RepID=A0A1X9NJ38_9GAMM|nr:hypothetical protein [Oceanicoccus sagamiensis]ARN74003.1 hypothetical protein BST96_07650 [Oceanicoccus sagamiensis]
MSIYLARYTAKLAMVVLVTTAIWLYGFLALATLKFIAMDVALSPMLSLQWIVQIFFFGGACYLYSLGIFWGFQQVLRVGPLKRVFAVLSALLASLLVIYLDNNAPTCCFKPRALCIDSQLGGIIMIVTWGVIPLLVDKRCR